MARGFSALWLDRRRTGSDVESIFDPDQLVNRDSASQRASRMIISRFSIRARLATENRQGRNCIFLSRYVEARRHYDHLEGRRWQTKSELNEQGRLRQAPQLLRAQPATGAPHRLRRLRRPPHKHR